MPHIHLPEGLTGISAGFAFRPETENPMQELAHILLAQPNTLSRGERELIAMRVSSGNGCYYCEHSHGATAAHHLGCGDDLLAAVKQDFHRAEISPKLKALLAIAAKVQECAKSVTPIDIELACQSGVSDLEIHDAVLIAAAFCMYNRYVEGLGMFEPRDLDFYVAMGEHDAKYGYLPVPPESGDVL